MISDSKKFIFIHIPKTGGNTVQKILEKYSNNKLIAKNSSVGKNQGLKIIDKTTLLDIKHNSIKYYEVKYPEKYKTYYKFCVIRNIYDRLISAYFFHNHSTIENPKEFDENDFIDFIRAYKKNEIFNYIIDRNGEIVVKNYIDFSNLIPSLKETLIKIGILDSDIDLLDFDIKLNKSNHKHYSQYYTKKSQNVVEKNFKKEIDYFNWSC